MTIVPKGCRSATHRNRVFGSELWSHVVLWVFFSSIYSYTPCSLLIRIFPPLHACGGDWKYSSLFQWVLRLSHNLLTPSAVFGSEVLQFALNREC